MLPLFESSIDEISIEERCLVAGIEAKNVGLRVVGVPMSQPNWLDVLSRQRYGRDMVAASSQALEGPAEPRIPSALATTDSEPPQPHLEVNVRMSSMVEVVCTSHGTNAIELSHK